VVIDFDERFGDNALLEDESRRRADSARSIRLSGQFRSTTQNRLIFRQNFGDGADDALALMRGNTGQGPKIRLGQISKTYHPYTEDKDGNKHYDDSKLIDNPDVVEGTVLLQKGADADPALVGLEEKTKEVNEHILPKGVKVVPFLDRSDLVHLTTHTVLHNLAEGMILVAIVLFLFLGNVRGAIIVALTIPFALLFASTCLDLRHIPANLLSLGALDFGMVVDGAVVMVENIVRHLNRKNGALTIQEKIEVAAHEVQRPVFYATRRVLRGTSDPNSSLATYQGLKSLMFWFS
jgi:multidrug efflux pump subunit AcrB